jgi:GMP synthase-like glutamine amidotransferase
LLIYLVDNTIDGQGASPREVRAVLGRLIPGLEILIEPFHHVSLERVRSLKPSHIILSGQSHPWEMYTPESLAGVFAVIKQASQPILGICGGHQQIAIAYGAKVGLMERLEPGEGYNGAKRERGFLPIQNTGEGLFKGLQAEITVWHNHCDEVKGRFSCDRVKRDVQDPGDAAEGTSTLQRPVPSRAFRRAIS